LGADLSSPSIRTEIQRQRSGLEPRLVPQASMTGPSCPAPRANRSRPHLEGSLTHSSSGRPAAHQWLQTSTVGLPAPAPRCSSRRPGYLVGRIATSSSRRSMRAASHSTVRCMSVVLEGSIRWDAQELLQFFKRLISPRRTPDVARVHHDGAPARGGLQYGCSF
jgi:hypothetical protein